MKTKIAQIALALLYLFSANLLAENSTTIPGYKIHHNALPTAALDSEVAKAYQIQRSKYRGLLNVSVIKTQAGTTGSPAHAIVQGLRHQYPWSAHRHPDAGGQGDRRHLLPG